MPKKHSFYACGHEHFKAGCKTCDKVYPKCDGCKKRFESATENRLKSLHKFEGDKMHVVGHYCPTCHKKEEKKLIEEENKEYE